MSGEVDEKSFDVMTWLRATRDEINEQIADMSGEELREWLARGPSDVSRGRLYDRAGTDPEADDARSTG